MKNIIVLCGGMSAEHEVSLRSARNVIAALDKNKFNPILVLVSRSGTWYVQKTASILETITACEEPFTHGEIGTLVRKVHDTFLITLSGQQTKIDAAFPLIHGTMGEDGTLQGLFEIMNCPYVGSGVLSSAVCMDKDFLKEILQSKNIPVVPFISLLAPQCYPDFETACDNLKSKILFIKPAAMGSSVGVCKVKSEAEYAPAIEQAFKYSTKVLIEKFIPCREIECAVLGNKNPKASVLGEIKPNHDFYSYEAKYLDPNGADLIIPASLSSELTDAIQKIAIDAYIAAECRGMARADFFLSQDNQIFVNELNTIPGFTSISMYPKLWEATGTGYSDIITKLIDFAFDEHAEKQKICLRPDVDLDSNLQKKAI